MQQSLEARGRHAAGAAMHFEIAKPLQPRPQLGVENLIEPARLRIDYHAAAAPGDLTVRGKVVRFGGQFSTAEAHVFDAQGKLIASGRGTYVTAPPKA